MLRKQTTSDNYCYVKLGNTLPAWVLPADLDRFWVKVERRGPEDCWLWTSNLVGGKPGRRYGQFSVCHPDGTPRKRLAVYAHRFAWMVTHGPIPDGLEICHSCDQPRCVNVAHMRLGTRYDNMGDARDRGRLHMPRPTRQKVTPEQLLEIDALLMTGGRGIKTRIAERYGVSKTWVTLYAKGIRRQYDRPATEQEQVA